MMKKDLRSTSLAPTLASAAALAFALGGCGDDSVASSAAGGGGAGGAGATTSTNTSTVGGVTTSTSSQTSSSQSSSSSQGGAGQGGEGQGGDGQGGEGGAPAVATSLFVAANPAGRDGDAVLRLPLDLGAAEATYGGLGDITSLENVDIESDGDGWIAYDRRGGTGGLMFVTALESAPTGALGGGTRRIEGPLTGMMTPKGVRVIESASIVLVADTAARDIKAFSTLDEGDVAPLFVVDDLGNDARAAWDMDYDAASDILYVAGTDGVVLVYDDFAVDEGQGGPSRTITPASGGAKISVNLHGIELVDTLLDPAMLVLTDVGDAAVANDGQIFTITSPSSVSGLTQVRARIGGPLSMLGNPVDLDFDGNALFVAEKSNDRLLRFDGVTGLTGASDRAPNGSAPLTKAESVVVTPGLLVPTITTIGNPAGRDADVVVRFDSNLTAQATLGAIGVIQSLESVAIAADGTAFATIDLAAARGAVLVAPDLASAADGTALGGGARRIEGPLTGLIAPKGVQLTRLGGADVLLVADVGGTARDVKVFAVDASGNTPPLFVVEDLGADRAPWDMHYDAGSDRLFVACTDGAIAVFDTFSATSGVGGPDRVITPAVGGVDVSVNLHGIEYLPSSDLIVVSDVGDAAIATDGQLFTIEGAATADGLTDVRARISGAASMLGNPVDIAAADGAIYIAEKSNDRILRYDDIALLMGDLAIAPDQETMVTKPESVFVRFE